jgi:mannose-6-phosphate isomerase-like protein (cupin superfamily)
MPVTDRLLPASHDVLAPDGSEVRLLAAGKRGSMAHFRLPPGGVSKPVRHRSVEEVWFIVAGRGRMWRKDSVGESVIALLPGQSLVIPVGVAFQFRNDGTEPLDAVGVTMPPWPGMDEAEFVEGAWPVAAQ